MKQDEALMSVNSVTEKATIFHCLCHSKESKSEALCNKLFCFYGEQ